MSIAIIITTFNRPFYLKQCLNSLRRADLSKVESLMIVDDCSTDHETINLINEFKKEHEGKEFKVIVYPKLENKSIRDSLLTGFDLCFSNGYDLVINLDGDAIVRNDFIDRIVEVKEKYPAMIVSGFNTNTKNKDGSIRHKQLWEEDGIVFRPSIGGINMCINKEQYHKWVRPALIKSIAERLNWDDHTCRNSAADSIPIAVIKESVVQHIGFKSSMGHDSGGEPADTADNFKLLSLPNITLIQTGCVDLDNLIKACDICCEDIKFGAVKILSSLSCTDPRIIKIPHINNMQEYSQFILKKLNNYVDTEFALTFHPDGYVVNAAAWRKEWLEFDYIGAVWNFYAEGEYRVGNGGFALRSKKLLQILANDDIIVLRNDHLIKNYAEDHNIGKIYRKYLEFQHGIKFATEQEASKFSVENYGVLPPFNKYNDSFGFHSIHTDFTGADIKRIPYSYPNPTRKINYL